MPRYRLPLLTFVLLCGLFLLSLGAAALLLPARVATHFAGDGRANDWMSLNGHLLFTALLGFGMAGISLASGWLLNTVPDNLFSLPRRDYWLAPERRAETMAYFRRQFCWLAILELAFVTVINLLLIAANANLPPHLPMTPILVLTGGFLLAVGGWALLLVRHFLYAD